MPHSKQASHASEPSAQEEGAKLGFERLLFFSDAVYAIAITLLVLEIRLPVEAGELNNDQLLAQLLALWPKYLAYALSFWVIASFWTRHHTKFRYVGRYDRRLILLNLLNLMFIAFLPFPTAVIATSGNRTATIFYALSVALAGLSAAATSYYIMRKHGLAAAELSAEVRRRSILRSLVAPAVFLLSIGVAFFDADVAKFTWALMIPAGLLLRDPLG